jgi:hypothetical protein
MSDDMQDLMARLQMSLGQQANQGPSLYGLQAQQDPNQTAAILKRIQDQAYVSQQGNGPNAGEFGMINSQAKKDAARFGQGIGNLMGVGQPQQYDNSAMMQQRAAIQGGKGQLADLLAQPGADPLQARVDVLSKLAAAGVPNAADALAKAQDDLIKMQTSKATAFKDTEQGLTAADERKARAAAQAHTAFEEAGQTWHYVSTTDGVARYVNDHGEPKVVTVQPSKTIAGIADGVDPAQVSTILQAIKDGRMKPLDPSGTFAKTPMGKAILTAQAADTSIDSTNFGTKIKTLKDFATGAEGKQVTSFNVAQSHLDVLKDAAAGLDNNNLPVANKVLNSLGVQSGGTAQAAFAATKNVVANEIIKTIVPGQSAESDRQEVQNEITSAQTPAQLKAVIEKYQELMSGKLAGLRQQYEQGSGRTDFEAKLSKRAIELARSSPAYTSQFPAPGTTPTASAGAPQSKVVDFGSLK